VSIRNRERGKGTNLSLWIVSAAAGALLLAGALVLPGKRNYLHIFSSYFPGQEVIVDEASDGQHFFHEEGLRLGDPWTGDRVFAIARALPESSLVNGWKNTEWASFGNGDYEYKWERGDERLVLRCAADPASNQRVADLTYGRPETGAEHAAFAVRKWIRKLRR
jgi:hypothetical protein